MKKMLLLSTLIPFAIICSCQKQDSSAEAQLAQRKTELDVREEALVQREKAVDEREKAVAEREKAVANSRVVQPHAQVADPAQAEAERQRRIQQLPPDLRALIPDRSQVDGAKDRLKQDRLSQGQRGPEELQSHRQRKSEAIQKWQISGATASPVSEVPSPSPSPSPQ
jgi:hypothetical protein